MARIRFLYDNLASRAASVALASSQVTALPAANAQVPDRTLVWRSATQVATDEWLRIDLGSSQNVTGMAIANPRLHPSGGTLKLQHSPDAVVWTDQATIPAMDTDSRVTFLFFTQATRRYWRFYFTNVGGVTDYVELGYVFIGTYLEPAVNINAPAKGPLLGAQSVVMESLDGQRTTTTRTQRASGSWAWGTIGDADLASLQAMFRTCDYGTPFFHVLDTARGWTAWLAYFNSALDRSLGDLTGQYDPTFDWIEAV